jgi:hypothetical protein
MLVCLLLITSLSQRPMSPRVPQCRTSLHLWMISFCSANSFSIGSCSHGCWDGALSLSGAPQRTRRQSHNSESSQRNSANSFALLCSVLGFALLSATAQSVSLSGDCRAIGGRAAAGALHRGRLQPRLLAIQSECT